MKLVGPVYIAHPYSAPTAELRRRNVELAASLSSAVNRAGCATISPLQESQGREDALTEEQWIQHGLVLLRGCVAMVSSDDWRASRGCKGEIYWCSMLGIPWFEAQLVSLDSDAWYLPTSFVSWVQIGRTHALPLSSNPESLDP